MLTVVRDSWSLLLGLLLLMLGNGLQATLLGVRGAIEGMTPATLSFVMSAYFVGLLISARVTPLMIQRVGHVRVFAALAALISAGFILYAVAPDPWVWAATRFVVGFCFCGVYIVSESWLNERATNATRGQAMSVYMLVQSLGIVTAQGLLLLADPGGYALFALISILVSVAVAPMLLSAAPAPPFRTSKPMTLRRLFAVSPLGCVGTFLLGGVFAAMFGMAAVYGAEAGLSVAQISALTAAIYLGGMIFQWPLGWLSDRIDRRLMIVAVATLGAAAALGAMVAPSFIALLLAAGVIGGSVSPLYSLLVAHTNDFLSPEDMAAGSGGMLFLNGVGAVGGPLAVGFLMGALGAAAYFAYFAVLLVAIALYGVYRMTQRPAPEGPAPFAPIPHGATALALTAEPRPAPREGA